VKALNLFNSVREKYILGTVFDISDFISKIDEYKNIMRKYIENTLMKSMYEDYYNDLMSKFSSRRSYAAKLSINAQCEQDFKMGL
jgi:hypothetical protein